MNYHISAIGLTQHQGKKRILSELTFEIGKGIFALLGPNGAGKTTLLRTLATVLLPTGGTLRLGGLDVFDPHQRRQLRRRIGYLPQHLGYYADFTVQEFVEYLALLKEMPPSEIQAAVQRAIMAVGLNEEANSRMKTLSGGMLRRAGIAQAIVNSPDFLLLDEPTVGLDPRQRIEFRQLIKERGQSSTVLISTHLVEDVAAACDEVGILNQGQLIYRSTPRDLERLGTLHGNESELLGDTLLEKGYSHILLHRAVSAWKS